MHHRKGLSLALLVAGLSVPLILNAVYVPEDPYTFRGERCSDNSCVSASWAPQEDSCVLTFPGCWDQSNDPCCREETLF